MPGPALHGTNLCAILTRKLSTFLLGGNSRGILL
ncbi:hypothetical protein Zm00014a_037721 [Zea mays]|uniref:Uncharacterized protein n=1 Tax=Zea mays TaxID=4577 RepID=A0A3L6EHN4_MAIZE|nr:hypothetical protein Zm00014a_037721 [Zea mays]